MDATNIESYRRSKHGKKLQEVGARENKQSDGTLRSGAAGVPPDLGVREA